MKATTSSLIPQAESDSMVSLEVTSMIRVKNSTITMDTHVKTSTQMFGCQSTSRFVDLKKLKQLQR
jgi:hypothetical protein